MISKIIQKERKRQEEYLHDKDYWKGSADIPYCKGLIESHKRSLINLKEYIKQYMEFAYIEALERAKEDIKELTKLIEAYNEN